ncbi:hypothetical protein LCGC14_3127510 [marine sediment metagenome]|uniref:Uncharacterized protein n=1 Tax=marine sediment metagenome TaxID=412755 RepID=A0A0F8YQ28_9ZZZZ
MPEITVSTDDGKVAIHILVSEKDIAIFIADNCDTTPIDGLETDKDSIMVLASEATKADTAVAKADDDIPPVRTQFGELE